MPLPDTHHSRRVNPQRKRFIRDLFGGDDANSTCDRGGPRQRCIFASMGFLLVVLIKKLPPMKTRVIPVFEGKTPVAQMHFASELPPVLPCDWLLFDNVFWCFFGVTGGRPVLTSAAAGGGAPGPPKFCGGGNRRECFPPHRSCARSEQAVRLGTKEEAPENHSHLQITHNSVMG
jgi:hypothetical protein